MPCQACDLGPVVTMPASSLGGVIVAQLSPLRSARSCPSFTSTTTEQRSVGLQDALVRAIMLHARHQPKTIPSPLSDGAGSGSRIIRNELTNPQIAARSGMRSATWSAIGRASVLIQRISSWTSCG